MLIYNKSLLSTCSLLIQNLDYFDRLTWFGFFGAFILLLLLVLFCMFGSVLYVCLRLEMSIFLTGRDQSFMYTYMYVLEIDLFMAPLLDWRLIFHDTILEKERLIFSVNLIIKRFFKKKDK